MKFGILVPSNIEVAVQLDKSRSNMFKTGAISKKLNRVIAAFKLLKNNEPIPIGSKNIL